MDEEKCPRKAIALLALTLLYIGDLFPVKADPDETWRDRMSDLNNDVHRGKRQEVHRDPKNHGRTLALDVEPVNQTNKHSSPPSPPALGLNSSKYLSIGEASMMSFTKIPVIGKIMLHSKSEICQMQYWHR